MSAKTTPTDEPAHAEAALAAALAAFQAEMPHVGKSNSANAGTYQYSYADLADITKLVLPVMAKHGLSFSAKPTLNEDGKFVLQYTLRHARGGRDVGEYPLPTSGTPQQIGSAISYARRYCFSAVTGVAPDEDDDGRAAADAPTDYWRRRPQQAQNGRQAPTAPARDTRPPAGDAPPSEADKARAALRAHCGKQGYDMARVAARFEAMYEGRKLRTDDDANRITAFTKLLDGMPEAELLPIVTTNGAAQ